jgi:hypothetical protein
LARPETIKPIEATRLLWNRGSGLLFARSDLQTGRDLSVVHRNQSKAKLALGDALLTIRGKYRAFVRERQMMLREMDAIAPRIAELHEIGVSFKLRPTVTPDVEALRSTQEELTDLWLKCFLEVESDRLGVTFGAPREYALFRAKLFPETSSLRNFALNLRDRIKRSGGLRPVCDYPRGSLQRALVLLLEPKPDYPQIGRLFGQPIADLNEAVTHYKKWWQFYS